MKECVELMCDINYALIENDVGSFSSLKDIGDYFLIASFISFDFKGIVNLICMILKKSDIAL